jgi:hypothetical protein
MLSDPPLLVMVIPVMIDLFLVFTFHHKGNSFIKSKTVIAGAIHGHEDFVINDELGMLDFTCYFGSLVVLVFQDTIDRRGRE